MRTIINENRVILKATFHAVVMPLLSVAVFGIAGYLYLLVPITAYHTMSKHSASKKAFYMILLFVIAFGVAGWTDASITDAYPANGGF